MENIHEPQHGGSDLVDPLSHLALLNRSKTSPGWQEFLNFGPWWYAPLWATFVGGLTLGQASLFDNTERISGDPSGGVVFETQAEPVFLIVGLAAAIVLTVDSLRRRTVKSKPTAIGFLLTCAVVGIVAVAMASWSVAVAVVGYESFVFGWAVVAWLATSLFFLAVRSALGRLAERRRVATV